MQVRSALQLIGPMGDVIEVMQKIIVAHHPAGYADDCPVCRDFATEFIPALDRWADAKAQVEEHWDV